MGLEAPIVAILAAFSRKRVARATSRGSGEASRVGNDVGASLPGFGRLEFCWLAGVVAPCHYFAIFGQTQRPRSLTTMSRRETRPDCPAAHVWSNRAESTGPPRRENQTSGQGAGRQI